MLVHCTNFGGIKLNGRLEGNDMKLPVCPDCGDWISKAGHCHNEYCNSRRRTARRSKMLKAFRIKGTDGGWLHIEETENLESVRICIDYPDDSQSSVWLDKDGFMDLLDLRYKLDIHYPVKAEEEGEDAKQVV